MFWKWKPINFACKVCKRKAGLLKAVEGQTAKELCLQSLQDKTGILKDVEGQTAKNSPARFARVRSDFYRILKAKEPRNFACKVCKRKTGLLVDVEGQTAKKLRLQGLQEKGHTFKGGWRPQRQETLLARFARGRPILCIIKSLESTLERSHSVAQTVSFVVTFCGTLDDSHWSKAV